MSLLKVFFSQGFFLTKIFHPNVSEKGEICVNTLKKDWNPQAWSLSNIFQVIKCLLIVPFPESALNQQAGKMFMEDYQAYCKHAKLLTQVYAKPKVQTALSALTENKLPAEEGEGLKEKNGPTKKQNDKKKWLKRI